MLIIKCYFFNEIERLNFKNLILSYENMSLEDIYKLEDRELLQVYSSLIKS